MKTAERQLSEQFRFLAEEPELQLAVVFGSAALGACRIDSDIDLAVHFAGPMNPQQYEQLVDKIALATGRPVDLIDLSTAGGSLLRQIIRSGRILFCKNPGLPGFLTQRVLDWQEDFEPQLMDLYRDRLHRFTEPVHGP
ncbi:MAG TPA: nucleotidyltransferase domain-containing protein [Oceanipulchritudo sp.]|nr:nucleotidyltransferase domain-containing protein [Oceanipulchritudo sp.]